MFPTTASFPLHVSQDDLARDPVGEGDLNLGVAPQLVVGECEAAKVVTLGDELVRLTERDGTSARCVAATDRQLNAPLVHE